MKSVLLSLLILTLSSCSWFDAPRGNKNLQGSFIYYDFDPSAFSENQATILFYLKQVINLLSDRFLLKT